MSIMDYNEKKATKIVALGCALFAVVFVFPCFVFGVDWFFGTVFAVLIGGLIVGALALIRLAVLSELERRS